MQRSQRDTARLRWIRPVSGLCLLLSVVLSVLMLYMPFQFQSATLRFLYPHLRWVGLAYGIAGILTGVAEVPVGLPGWIGKLGKLIFLGTLALQAYLIAFLPGVITGQFLYSMIILAVLASLVRPDREWAILGALLGASSLIIGLLVLFKPGQFPTAVFGTVPPGLGPIMKLAGLLLVASLWMPGNLRPPLWAALLLVALPLLWFAWQWLLVNNWVGISMYGSLGGWAAICAAYVRFPWHMSLSGLRMRILMLGLVMTALPLVTMGTFSVYVAQTLDAGEANHALRTAILQVERAAERLSAADADGEPPSMDALAAEAARVIAATPVNVTVRPFSAAPGERADSEGIRFREEFLGSGQRALTATLDRPDLGLTLVAAQSAGQAFDQANRLAVTAVLITMTVGLAAIFVNRFLAVRLTMNLAGVRDVASAIGAHRYEARVTIPDGPADEITDLARTVNSVAETLGEYGRKLNRLLSITDTALAHLSLPNLIDELLVRIRDALHADSAMILLLSEDRTELVVAGATGLEIDAKADLRIPIGVGVAGQIAASCKPLIIENVAEFPVVSRRLHDDTCSLVGAPLLVEDRVIGVVHVGTRSPRKFTPEEVSLLQMVGDRIALAIDHARIYAAEVVAREEVEAKTREIQLLNAGLEKRVADRTAELVSANRELEAFSYSVSHDLRSPLRSINGFSQILLEDYADRLDDLGREYLERICAGTLRMDQLIEAFLRLSRVIRADLIPQAVDLTGMAMAVVSELRSSEGCEKAKVTILPGMRVTADAHLLRVAVENLLSNACKFSAPRSQPVIEVGAHRENGETVYFVRDNGVGFDMASAGKLFQPFQRLHAEREFKGAGIGLATVQRIIQRHGGRIWAESRVGEGAVFSFTLPAPPAGR